MKKGVLGFETGLNCRIYRGWGYLRSKHDVSTFEQYHKERLAFHHSFGAMTQRLGETQRKPQSPVCQISNALPNLRSLQETLPYAEQCPIHNSQIFPLTYVGTIFYQFRRTGSDISSHKVSMVLASQVLVI